MHQMTQQLILIKNKLQLQTICAHHQVWYMSLHMPPTEQTGCQILALYSWPTRSPPFSRICYHESRENQCSTLFTWPLKSCTETVKTNAHTLMVTMTWSILCLLTTNMKFFIQVLCPCTNEKFLPQLPPQWCLIQTECMHLHGMVPDQCWGQSWKLPHMQLGSS